MKYFSLSNHFLLGLSEKSGRIIKNLYRQEDYKVTDSIQYLISSIEVEVVPLPDILKGSLIFAIRATSSRLQDFFVGRPNPKYIFLSRLSESGNRTFTHKNMNSFSHPLD